MNVFDSIGKMLSQIHPGERPICCLRLHDTSTGDGETELVQITSGSIPQVEEFVVRTTEEMRRIRYRVTSRIHAVVGDSLIPICSCHEILDEDYAELSDTQSDYLVVLIQKDGTQQSMSQVKKSDVPPVGSRIRDSERWYLVEEHLFVLLNRVMSTMVVAKETLDQPDAEVRSAFEHLAKSL